MTLREAAHAERDAYLETLASLVRLESPTHDPVAVNRLADTLEALLKERVWAVDRLAQTEVGDQLIARKEAPGDISTLLLAHYDTVWPVGTLETMPLKQEGDKLHGPGVLDMKAGVACALHAVGLAERAGGGLRGPVTLLLTSDEETGSRHSRALIERLATEHDRVLVLEPGMDDGALKTGRKGVGEFRLHFRGKSAHAGNHPELGASALRELAHFLLEVETLNDPAAGTSVNLTVAAGGSASNVIAEEARARVDVRIAQLAEAERVDRAIRGYEPKDARVTVEVEGGVNRPPLEFTDANRALFEEAQLRLNDLGLELSAGMVGGGSDGNFTSALAVATLDGLGAVGSGPHARHEHILISASLDRLALLTALLSKL